MAALRSERRVFLWRLTPRTSPADALGKDKVDGGPVAVTLDEIICLLESEFSGNRARIYLGPSGRLLSDDDPTADEKSQIYIADLKRNDEAGVFTLLMNRGDPNVPPPGFINTDTGTVRTEEPQEGETPGASAHLIIAEAGDVHGHRACFEQMPHVSGSLVMSALERIIANAISRNPTYRFREIKHDRNGRPHITWRAYRPTFEHHRVPSDRLIDDLDIGELGEVTLTKRSRQYAGPALDDIITREEQKIVIRLKATGKDTIRNAIGHLLNQAKGDGYESVTFGVTNLPGKSSAHPTISLDDEDAMAQLYVRSQRIENFSTLLEQCYASICLDIEAKMIEQINEAHW